MLNSGEYQPVFPNVWLIMKHMNPCNCPMFSICKQCNFCYQSYSILRVSICKICKDETNPFYFLGTKSKFVIFFEKKKLI